MRLRKIMLLLFSTVILCGAFIITSSAEFTSWNKDVSDSIFTDSKYVYSGAGTITSSTSGTYYWDSVNSVGSLTFDYTYNSVIGFRIPVFASSSTISDINLSFCAFSSNFKPNSGLGNGYVFDASTVDIYYVSGSVKTKVTNYSVHHDGRKQITFSNGQKNAWLGSIYINSSAFKYDNVDYIYIYPHGFDGSGKCSLGITSLGVQSSNGVQVDILNVINSANLKIDSLLDKLDDLNTDIGVLVTSTGQLSTSSADILDALESLEEGQSLVLYQSSADGIVLNEINDSIDAIKDRLSELSDILDQYPSQVDVEDTVETISNATTTYTNYLTSNDYSSYTDGGAVYSAFFDNSFISTILVVILGLVLLSYILFGKKA